MSEEELEFAPPPTPALPLEYFDRRSGPWVAVVRLMAWVGIFYSGIMILSELTWVLVYLLEEISRTPTFRMNFVSSVVAGLLPAVNAIVLLIGCIMTLQRSRGGRLMLLGASIAAVVIAMLSLVISLVATPLTRYPSSFRLILLIQQLVGGFLTALQHSVVPVLLWIVFRKREVREVFDAS
jgi:hypothetical protein